MKTNLEKISNLERKLTVDVPPEVVQTTINNIYRKIQKQAEIKGFRKGKAPLSTIQGLYSEQARQDAIKRILQDGYIKGLTEHSIEPATSPEFDFSEFDENNAFSFSVYFEIFPEIELKQYENLTLKKEKLNIQEDKIEKVIKNILESKATYEPVLEDRPLQENDTAVINFEGFIDGQPLENGKAEDQTLVIGSNQFIPGFEEGLIGMKPEQEKTIHLNFPEQYHVQDLKGKPVEFKVKLNAIKKKVLPELTDELVKSIEGSYQNIEELRTAIQDDIKHNEEKRINDSFKNRLVKTLVSLNPMDAPPSMISQQKQALIDDFKQRMQQQGMSENDFNEYTKKWDSDFEKSAEEIVKSSFLISKIAEKHNLTANAQDLEQKFLHYSKQTGLEIEKIREYYASENQKSHLLYQITEDRVINHVLNASTIEEVDASEITDL